MPGQEYWRKWLSSDYLTTFWDSAYDNWLQFWDSNLGRELTKPQTLKLFGLSALLGAVVPISIMIIWRIVRGRKNKKTDQKQYDDNSLGSFNTKLLGNIKSKQKDKQPDSFDPIQSKDESQSKNKKKHSKCGDKVEPSAPATNDKKHKEKKSKKSAKNKETTELNATRFNPPEFDPENFKLNEQDIDALSHMEFHGKLKSATLRARADKLEESMTADERENERKLKMEQLESIFKLMQGEGAAKFGIENKEELMEQFKFYSS